MENRIQMYVGPIFELTGLSAKFKPKREFVGYDGAALFKAPDHRLIGQFFDFEQQGPTAKLALEGLEKVIRAYVSGSVGHIHWRRGITCVEIIGGFRAACCLVVDEFIPPLAGEEVTKDHQPIA